MHMMWCSYIGSDKAIADLPFGPGNVASGGVGKFCGIKLFDVLFTDHAFLFVATYAFWRSAYISNLFSSRNRTLVITDWLKKTILGRDISRE